MSLMIDIGNTRIKYATFLGGRINEKGVHEGQSISKPAQRYSGKIKSLMLSSVKPIPNSILQDAFKLCPNYLVLCQFYKVVMVHHKYFLILNDLI